MYMKEFFFIVILCFGTYRTSAFSVFAVTNAADAGAGTLRQAILDSNATPLPGDNLILFDISPGGLHVITPLSPLPTISRPVIIEARSQPGYVSTPLIQLDGISAGAANGFLIVTVNCVISGFSITHFKSDGTDSTGSGIRLENGGYHRISANYIGVKPIGCCVGDGNERHGIAVWQSVSNLIGGYTESERNVISGNGTAGAVGNGVDIAYPNGTSLVANSNIIVGNYIGLDASGLVAVGNGNNGIRVSQADYTIIGDLPPGAGNVISGNAFNGILLEGPPDGMFGDDFVRHTLVQGNLIGTDKTGLAGLGNSANGMLLYKASLNLIGGLQPEARNVISGNGLNGIQVGGIYFGAGSRSNIIQGNYIGVGASGDSPLGNAEDGIKLWLLDKSATMIGSTNSGAGANIIAANGGNGVTVATGDGCLISRNSIFANTELGIDLGEFIFGAGVTFNDPGDTDTGPNAYQNFPVITNAFSDGYATVVNGWLNSEPLENYSLQFFWGYPCDVNNHGEGQHFIGETTVTTDGGGNCEFSATFPGGVPWAQAITATATMTSSNNTSEFSACGEVQVPPPLYISHDSGVLQIFWSAGYGPWVLQRSESLITPAWTDDPNPPSWLEASGWLLSPSRLPATITVSARPDRSLG